MHDRASRLSAAILRDGPQIVTNRRQEAVAPTDRTCLFLELVWRRESDPGTIPTLVPDAQHFDPVINDSVDY